MAKPTIRLYRVAPGANAYEGLVQRFGRDGGGVATSFDDAMLRPIHQIVGELEDVEVVPFGMLVRRTLEASGESSVLLATRSQHLAAIAEAVAALDEDTPYREAFRFPGNREALAELLSELDAWEVDLDELLGSDFGPSQLRSKLDTFSRIQKSVRNLLSRVGRELSGDQLRRCVEGFIEPDLRLPRVLIVIGQEVAPAKVRWVRWLAGQGIAVTVIAPRHVAVESMFADCARLASDLDCAEERLGAGTQLSTNLFADIRSPAVPVRTSIVAAANPLAECEWAFRYAAESDASRTAIFVRDGESYTALLESAAEASGVDLVVQRRTELLLNGFARLTLDILQACGSGDVRKLGPLLKRSYLVPDKLVRASVEQAIEAAWAAGEGQWNCLDTLIRKIGPEALWLERIIEWRMTSVVEDLSLTGWLGKLIDLGAILVDQSMERMSADYDLGRDERAFHVMQNSLLTVAQLEAVGASRTYSFKQFIRKCSQIWSESDVSVPAAENGILVVNSVWAIPPVKRLIVLGMLEGKFPRRRRENPILNDRERLLISETKATSRPLRTSADDAEADREAFYALCASASEEIHFSYPASDDDKDNIPTFYLQRVREAVDGVETMDRTNSDPPARLHGCESSLEQSHELEALSEGIPFLAQSRQEPVTARELRDALVCPFQYQMKHRLKLFSNAKSHAWYNLRFLPRSANLFGASEPEAAEAELQEALRQELERLSPTLSEWETRLLQGGGNRLIQEWVRREFLARKIWPRSNHIFGARAIGEPAIREEMPGKVRLKTRVDGISHFNSSTKVLHLFDSTAPDQAALNEADQLYYGLFLIASYEPGFVSAIEVDGMDGNRALLLIGRDGFPHLSSRASDGVRVLDLSGSHQNAVLSRREFMEDVKRNLVVASSRIEGGQFQPTPSENCRSCDFGEICRSSLYFSDQAPEESVAL